MASRLLWTHYGLVIQNRLREQHITNDALDDYDQDLPF